MKVSVITVCYNVVDSIEKTILSVINQTYSDLEYIIIDGGSRDGTIDIIKKYADNISCWISEPDSGIYDAMNKGVKVATGVWVNFMNAGDTFHSSNILEKIFSNPIDADYLAGIARYPNGTLWYPISENFSFRDVYKGGGVNHQASFIKRELFTNGYDIENRIIADELFFLQKVVFQGKKYVPIPYIVSNYDNRGMSSIKDTQEEIFRERRKFMRMNLPLRVVKDYDKSIARIIEEELWKLLLRLILYIPKRIKRLCFRK